MNSVLTRWEAIRNTINRHQKAGKSPATLIAVSKMQGTAAIRPLLEAGHRDFGENRVQEALEKWSGLKTEYTDVKLHLIGPLQTNKIKDALSLFDVIHTIDREPLADAIFKEMDKSPEHATKEFFIQVNTGEERQKSGVEPFGLAALIDYIRAANDPYLNISGLMCIPPAKELPAPHFALLRTLAEKFTLPCLSMGMSDDYETALRLGATHIRVGTALFGERGGI
jgi:pyridoxal phosphate enzyme (YggS family)